MFENLNLRSTLLAAAAVPVNVFALLALWSGAVTGQWVVAVVAVLGAVATVVATYLIAERITERVSIVAQAAERVTNEELPALFAQFDTIEITDEAKAGSEASTSPAPDSGNGTDTGTGDVDVASPSGGPESFFWPDDELTSIMQGLTAVTPATTRLIAEHRARTAGRLSDLVQRLTRRNQNLLDEQIDYIDWLEQTEEKPDRLQQLFKLDHLANRLRRSSESVLVLAGSVSDRPRGGPAPMATVLRVAIGETKAYKRVKLCSVDQVLVAPDSAFDLAHLLAEVLENATQHSPSDTEVEIYAVGLGNGDYRITVVDHGSGMAEVDLVKANVLLTDPPELTLDHDGTIGLTVVGRLAERLGAIVDLTATPGTGVSVIVTVPASALVAEGSVGRPAGAASGRPGNDTGSAPAGGRVSSGDGAGALSKLMELGDDATGLVESNEWAAPAVSDESAQPLSSRPATGPSDDDDSGSPASPDPIRPADDEPASAPASEDEPAPAADGSPPPAAASRHPAGRPPAGGAEEPTLRDAVPSGADFELGLEHLLVSDDEGPSEPPIPDVLAGKGRAKAKPGISARDNADDGADDRADNGAADSAEETADDGEDEPWTPPVAPDGGAALRRRERSADVAAPDLGPRVKASTRNPEEVRSRISRYRGGLKGSIDGLRPPEDDDDNDPDDRKDDDA